MIKVEEVGARRWVIAWIWMDGDGDKWFDCSHSHPPAQKGRKPDDKMPPFGANLVLLPNPKHETYKTRTLCKGFLVSCWAGR